jgi:hypothetical protein
MDPSSWYYYERYEHGIKRGLYSQEKTGLFHAKRPGAGNSVIVKLSS